jgi:hypothetical protein
MACFKHGTTIDLATRESVSLPDTRGTTLRVTRGSIWITQENDTKDIVLRAGDTWVVEKNGLTILEAQESTTFCALNRQLEMRFVPERETKSLLATLGRYVYAAAAAFLATPRRQPVPYF